VRLPGISRRSALALTQYICQKCGSANSLPAAHFLAVSFLPPFVFGAFRLLRIGFLDTFDPFDSSCADLPTDFLDLALLSFVSHLVCGLPLEKSAIA
jgi:hypothetical protein